ncbi:MAG: arginine--tRNA ligase [Williamsia sp.]|nr:arginine--tRNA ligase [Williamsia sp.]
MQITRYIKEAVLQCLSHLYPDQLFSEKDFQLNQTKPEFEGDYTVVLFSLVKTLKQSPEKIGAAMGGFLTDRYKEDFSSYNIIKGFLNLTISDRYWLRFLEQTYQDSNYGRSSSKGKKVVIEFSSPNTNKPLHVGHLRNNFLGESIAAILSAYGYDTVNTCIVNDRGIHICKSMLAWQLFSGGETPDSTHKKGDHFVGDYYVKFNDEYTRQVARLKNEGMSEERAKKEAPVMKATQDMLVKWEQGDPEILSLWQRMNEWVYAGFDETYRRIGSHFDKVYYESQTYLLGKKYVDEGLENGVFYKEEDGSVWIDLTADGLDKKLLLRSDGTSVYITQDLALVKEKWDDFKPDSSIYVIGDEQNYHMKVLKLICEKARIPSADKIYHLSYGMIELPTGKMKSREGTVVDADDLMDEMIAVSKAQTNERGKVADFSADELVALYEMIGIGAMKFYLLRVDPKKKMVFNPEESIDLDGFTGSFVQYTHARTRSVLRKEQPVSDYSLQDEMLEPLEKALLIQLEQYPAMIEQAATEYNPSVIAAYVYYLAKAFNSFYNKHSIINAESAEKKQLRLRLCQLTSHVIAAGMQLLRIRVPERM